MWVFPSLEYFANPDNNGKDIFQRTYITDENKQILEGLYLGGMTYKGQRCAQKIEEAVVRTGLPTQTIKVMLLKE